MGENFENIWSFAKDDSLMSNWSKRCWFGILEALVSECRGLEFEKFWKDWILKHGTKVGYCYNPQKKLCIMAKFSVAHQWEPFSYTLGILENMEVSMDITERL